MSIELPQLLQFIFTSASQTVDILYQKLYIVIAKRLHGQAVKTPPFHGGNMGSIPLGVTITRADVYPVEYETEFSVSFFTNNSVYFNSFINNCIAFLFFLVSCR